MSPLAKNLNNMTKSNLSILLHHISKQSQLIEKQLSLKINKEIIKNFHYQHDKVTATKTYVRVLKKEIEQVKICANNNRK